MTDKKNPKLILRYEENCLPTAKAYTVFKIFNSTRHVPGDRLTKDEVEHLIGLGWSVEAQ